MNVRMMQQILAPSVQHAEKADLRAEMFRICGDFQQGRGGGSKQEAVQDLLVMKHQRIQFMRQCEDHVHIGDRQQFSNASGEPFIARVDLTLRAVAVATSNGELTITCLMGSNSLWRV